MLQLAVNVSTMFTELPMLERFAAVRAAGFDAVEVQLPYELDRTELKGELRKNGLKMVLFNIPPGNSAAGDRGLAADPARQEEFKAAVHKAAEWAADLGVERLQCLSGKRVSDYPYEEQRKTLVASVRYAAGVLAPLGIKLVIEHLNRYDAPGYLLTTPLQVLELLTEAGAANAYLQYDFYHAQREQGQLIDTLHQNLARIGHIQIADVPGRHQPGTGEINYRYVLREIDRSGYQGYVGLEYIPDPDTASSLGWLKELNIR